MQILGQQFTTIFEMDKDFAFKLAGILEESTIDLLSKLDDSVESLDSKKSKDILHTIKGSAANFGAEALMEKTREVESVIHLLNKDNVKEYNQQLDEIKQIFNLTLEELEKLK